MLQLHILATEYTYIQASYRNISLVDFLFARPKIDGIRQLIACSIILLFTAICTRAESLINLIANRDY